MKKLFSNKNIILAGYLLIAVTTLVSCKKLIEIPPNPATQITREQQFSDSTTAMSAVAGVYSYTLGQGIPYYDVTFTLATSLSAHEVSYAGSEDISQFYNFTLTPLNGGINSLWSSHYTSLYQVNDVLNGVTNNKGLSTSFIKQITGEMEVTRAFYYFNLVNLFGGAPLVTTTDYATNAQLPRATANAIYNQIVTDLNDAVKKLNPNYPSAGHMRPNLYTALAVLAKVHLYQGHWQAAFNEADSVIRSGLYNLEPTLTKVFLDGSNEAIWQVPNLGAYQGINEVASFVPYSGVAPSLPLTDSLLKQFEPGDLRFNNWLGSSVVGSNTLYYPYKYKVRSPSSSKPTEDYMMVRFAEMYLIRAEAAAELNQNLSVAVADINTIRSRSGLASVNPTTQAAILAAVRKERRTELFCEWGNRWFDLNRTSNDNKYPSAGQAPAVLNGWQTYNALYPIPQTQMQLNSHLTQNPGYH